MFPSLGVSHAQSRAAGRPGQAAAGSSGAWSALRSASHAAAGVTPVFQRVTHQASVSLRLSDEQQLKLSTLLQRVQQKCRSVKIEASTTRKTGHTMFIIKGPTEAAVLEAKRELTLQLAERVTLTMLIPASLRAFVIGAGGKNIRAITDETGVRIHIPPRSTDESAAKEAAMSSSDADADALGDPLLGEQIEITIDGDTFNAHDAQARIQDIVAERTSKITQRLTHVEPAWFPFIHGPRGVRAAQLMSQEGRGEVSVKVPPPQREGVIVVSGERELVPQVVRAIEAQVEDMRRSFRTLSFNISKRQHAFLVGDSAADILASTQCSVELPSVHDSSEAVMIRGPQTQLPHALTAAMDRVNAVAVETMDMRSMHPDADAAHLKRLVQWLSTYAPREDNVQVFMPRASAIDNAHAAALVEVVSEDAAAARRIAQTIEHQLRSLDTSSVRMLEIDPLAHGFVIGKKGQHIKAYEARGVDVMLPPEKSGRDDVLLVFRPGQTVSESERVAELDRVCAELVATAAQAADLRTEHLRVPSKYHGAILGHDRTVLNAIIGDDRLLVSLGGRMPVKQVAEPLTEDSIVVRGASEAVARAVAQIQRIAKDAEEDSIVNGFVDELSVPGKFVPHLIGRGGAGITKLREDLGVKLDIAEPDEGASSSVARTKPVPIKIVGRKECVAEAKARLSAQVERLADEVTQTIQVPQDMHGALIGQGGKYVTRLQDKYDVHINFPHGHDARLKPDEVSIRGGRKGVAEARTELLELLEYEKERNNTKVLVLPTRAIARVLGRAGATINQIRLESGADIDVDPQSDAKKPTTMLQLRGSNEAVAAAEAMIQAIVEEVESEAELHVTVPSAFHRHMIGPGGQRLHELIERAGGPSDPKSHTQMVRFPRTNSDQVLVRAPKDLAAKIAAVLESEAQFLASRVVYGAPAPVRLHNQLMARGGRKYTPWQTELGVQLIMPTWREYAQLGAPVNAADLEKAEPATVIKVLGPEEAVRKVVDEIAAIVAANPSSSHSRRQRTRAPASTSSNTHTHTHTHTHAHTHNNTNTNTDSAATANTTAAALNARIDDDDS